MTNTTSTTTSVTEIPWPQAQAIDHLPRHKTWQAQRSWTATAPVGQFPSVANELAGESEFVLAKWPAYVESPQDWMFEGLAFATRSRRNYASAVIRVANRFEIPLSSVRNLIGSSHQRGELAVVYVSTNNRAFVVRYRFGEQELALLRAAEDAARGILKTKPRRVPKPKPPQKGEPLYLDDLLRKFAITKANGEELTDPRDIRRAVVKWAH